MRMTRRGLLKSFAAAIAGTLVGPRPLQAAVDVPLPMRALTPERIEPTALTMEMILREFTRIVNDGLDMVRLPVIGHTEAPPMGIGAVLYVRNLPWLTAADPTGLMRPESITEEVESVMLDRHFGVQMEIEPKDLNLRLPEFSDRFLLPAAIAMRESIAREAARSGKNPTLIAAPLKVPDYVNDGACGMMGATVTGGVGARLIAVPDVTYSGTRLVTIDTLCGFAHELRSLR